MNDRLPAMLDTGSMISIVLVGVLARAKAKGFNVDSLEVIARTKIEPVYDASNNRIEFLGDPSEAEDQTVVTVSEKVYLPPHGSAAISARCEVKDEVTEGIKLNPLMLENETSKGSREEGQAILEN
ncbi:hypothetical protein Y032_0710g1733 [Ancylostoma ceylanicum]|uniref:Uncharacterized protein n=1 Tax=Ancylostoma ceylanicum TaxID=53326 RepID=A0A016WH32_9BILA|nr:hypothetical protein Y032_0710g1733 [Ancylostoma ceylanicum]